MAKSSFDDTSALFVLFDVAYACDLRGSSGFRTALPCCLTVWFASQERRRLALIAGKSSAQTVCRLQFAVNSAARSGKSMIAHAVGMGRAPIP